jgi:hypothetical protein
MGNLSIENLKHELEGMLRVQSVQLSEFAQKILNSSDSFDKATFEIALRLSDQALVHALKTNERLKEVRYLSLLSKVSPE